MGRPSYQQLDMMDCGAACLQSISKLLQSGKMTIFAHGYIFFRKTKITKRADTS